MVVVLQNALILCIVMSRDISPMISHAQYKCFVTFINDFSRYTWVYFLRSKSEVMSVFQTFVTFIENIKILSVILVGNTCPTSFMISYTIKALCLNALVFIPYNKMVWPNIRTDIYWMLFTLYYLSLLLLLNSGLRHYLP